MSGISCILLIVCYWYFCQNTFLKIQQKLGDQLEIRLSVWTNHHSSYRLILYVQAIAGYDEGRDSRQPRDLKTVEYSKLVS